MRAPELTFFCELDAPSLDTLLDEAVVSSLKTLRATLSLAVLDFSPQRAAVVRRLNRAGVPLTAWLLLPKEQGYWFNLDNAALALEFYERFRAWTQEEGLQWETIGLDIEPDIRDLSLLMRSGWRFLPRFMERLFWGGRLRRAERLYAQMVAQAHADGYHVEVYQLPFIAEERRARTTLLRRLSGLVDVQADREVWMLYTSFFRPLGAGMLASYAPQAQAIGLGVTGGGVEFPGLPQPRPLAWDEFARDLRLAWHWCPHLYIFSLEGCVASGYLERLPAFLWDAPIVLPQAARQRVDGWRRSLVSALWLSERLPAVVAMVTLAYLLGRRRGRRRDLHLRSA